MKITIVKTIHFILFLLTTVSCSKEVDIPEVSIEWNNQYDYALEPYINKNLTNIECLGVYSTNDTAYFAGLKNNHIWVKVIKFDRNKDYSNWNNVIYELNDIDVLEKSFKINLGYGEYRNINIDKLMFTGNSIVNDLNKLYIMNLSGSPIEAGANGYSNQIVLLKYKDIVKRVNSPVQSIISIKMWYNNSFYISYKSNSGLDHVLYSEKGDSLFVSKNHESLYINESSSIISNNPISYEQTIIVLKSSNEGIILRMDCKENIILWSTNLKSPFNEPINSKYTYSLLEKGNDIWKYKVNIVYMDGTKKEYQFKININDGVVTLID